jgi:hypothetical protein
LIQTLKYSFLSSGIIFLFACKAPNKSIQTHSTGRTKDVLASKKLNKKDAEELRMYFDAEQFRLSGSPKQAIKHYQEFIAKYPDNAAAHYNIAREYLKVQDLESAEKNSHLATELMPNNIYFLEQYVEILLYRKKTKQADHILHN